METSSSGESGHGFLAVESGGSTLKIRVGRGARRTEIAGVRDGHRRVRLAASAREGRASAELRRFIVFSASTQCSHVQIVAGVAAGGKDVRIHQADTPRLEARPWPCS